MPLPSWPDAISRYLEILKDQDFFDGVRKYVIVKVDIFTKLLFT